jgi:hypothetical protein
MVPSKEESIGTLIMRETLIESCVEKVIAHAAENGGRCRLGFVKELVGKVSQRAPLLTTE